MTSDAELVYRSTMAPWRDAPPSTAGGARAGADAPEKRPDPDRRDGTVYVYDAKLRLAVEVALATGRPLLLRGEPGSGKSSLAAFVARNLNWRYYEHVVTSRTQAVDLLWRFDAVRRLADAQAKGSGAAGLDDHDYVEPGVLWWILDRESARRRGAPVRHSGLAVEQRPELNAARDPHSAVVLIDEIDKADPDMPNGLLVPLGSRRFTVSETDTEVSRDPSSAGELLVILTTNEERELPPAFLRRCVIHHLPFPASQLVQIAARHAAADGFPLDADERADVARIARRVLTLRQQARALAVRPPGTAEFLDAARSYRSLGGRSLSDAVWDAIERLTLRKYDDEQGKDGDDAHADETRPVSA